MGDPDVQVLVVQHDVSHCASAASLGSQIMLRVFGTVLSLSPSLSLWLAISTAFAVSGVAALIGGQSNLCVNSHDCTALSIATSHWLELGPISTFLDANTRRENMQYLEAVSTCKCPCALVILQWLCSEVTYAHLKINTDGTVVCRRACVWSAHITSCVWSAHATFSLVHHRIIDVFRKSLCMSPQGFHRRSLSRRIATDA